MCCVISIENCMYGNCEKCEVSIEYSKYDTYITWVKEKESGRLLIGKNKSNSKEAIKQIEKLLHNIKKHVYFKNVNQIILNIYVVCYRSNFTDLFCTEFLFSSKM